MQLSRSWFALFAMTGFHPTLILNIIWNYRMLSTRCHTVAESAFSTRHLIRS